MNQTNHDQALAHARQLAEMARTGDYHRPRRIQIINDIDFLVGYRDDGRDALVWPADVAAVAGVDERRPGVA